MPARILGLDAAVGAPSAAMVVGGAVLAFQASDVERGAPTVLPGLVAEVLVQAPGGFDAVAVTIGPGSFTGLRAAIALAHGLAIGAGVPVLGVTVAEAILALLPDEARPVWIVTDTKRGRLFLCRAGVIETLSLEALPRPVGPVALAGDAAEAAAAHLSALGADVVLAATRSPNAAGAGLVGARRHAGLIPALAAQPLYVEPPLARTPASLRPAPA